MSLRHPVAAHSHVWHGACKCFNSQKRSTCGTCWFIFVTLRMHMLTRIGVSRAEKAYFCRALLPKKDMVMKAFFAQETYENFRVVLFCKTKGSHALVSHTLACVARLIQMCGMTHSHVWHDVFICVMTYSIHTWDMTHWHLWHDAFIRATCLIHMCETYVRLVHMCLIHMCLIHMSHSHHMCLIHICLIHMCNMSDHSSCVRCVMCGVWCCIRSSRTHANAFTHSHVWHDTFTHSHVWHDAFTSWSSVCGVAVCCSVLQCVAAEHIHMSDIVHSSWLASICVICVRGVAVCCSVLQCVAVCVAMCSKRIIIIHPYVSSVCVVLHCVAVYCSVLQCVLQCAANASL